ncbi:MAG: F0F1 ATP synthase subunit B [Nitrospinae bacterium]|nr:F0F1 ATP synthase subunit B [Nitrospinota bacterium]
MPQLEQTSVFASLIFWSFVSFGLLFFLLRKYAFPPLLEILEEREKKIRGDIQGAENLKLEAQTIKQSLERELGAAHERAATIIQMAADESKRIQEKTIQETQARMKQLQKDAEQEIQASRNKLFGEIRGYTAALTISSTEKILRKVIGEGDRKRLADEAIEEALREIGRSKSA